MEFQTGKAIGVGGIELAWRFAGAVGTPKGVVVLAHGAAEHIGRYTHVFEALTANGLACLGYDHRGHGDSGGKRVFLTRFGEYVEDLHTVVQLAQTKAPGLPVYLLAHSMGGLVGAGYLVDYPSGPLRGAVISGPALGLALKVPAWKNALGKAMSKVWPTLAIPTGVEPRLVSRDPAVVAAYANDPKVTKKATARWYTELLAEQARVLARAGEIKTPLLLVFGGKDQLTSVPAMETWFAAVGASDKTLIPYPELFHEVMNEPEKDTVLADIGRWIGAHA